MTGSVNKSRAVDLIYIQFTRLSTASPTIVLYPRSLRRCQNKAWGKFSQEVPPELSSDALTSPSNTSRVVMHFPQCRSPQKLFFIQNVLFQTVCKQLLFQLQGLWLLSPRCTYVFGALNTDHYQQSNMLPHMLEDGVSTEAEVPMGAAASLSKWRFAVEET